MTAPGVIVVPLVAPAREEQLQAEVAELRARLEMAEVDLARTPVIPPEGAELILVGGGWVGEYAGWLWLVRGTVARRLWPAEPAELEQANVLRERAYEERRRNAS